MKKSNRGSAIIEITLLVPVLFGCIYFFIMTMLFLIRQAQVMDIAADKAYESADNVAGGVVTECKQGSVRIVKYQEEMDGYNVLVEIKVDDSDPVRNLRRWQLVADTVR